MQANEEVNFSDLTDLIDEATDIYLNNVLATSYGEVLAFIHKNRKNQSTWRILWQETNLYIFDQNEKTL